MRKALGIGILLLAVVGCSSSAHGTGTSGGPGDGTGPGTSGGPSGPGGPAVVTEMIAEKEPNDGPDRSGMQNVGVFSESKTLIIKGRLETGGNDGQRYTGDIDAFAFSIAAAGGQISVDVQWTGTADVDVIAYDAMLKPIAADTSTAKPIALPKAPAPMGDFEIALFSKDMPADYTLTITYTKGAGGPGGTGGSCVSPLQASAGGGCSFTMNEPATNGAAIALPYVFGWRSDGCETPGKVVFYGNPPTPANSVAFEYTRGGQMSLLNVTGQHTLTQSDLAALTSDNGVYHWQLESFYGNKSEARTFTINGTACK